MVVGFPFLAWMLGLGWAVQGGVQDPCRLAADAHSRGDLTQAATLLEQCVADNPGEIAWLFRLCAVYQTLKRDDDLFRAALLGVERFPQEPRFYQTAGVRAARKGDLEQSISLFEQALRRWPDDAGVSSNLIQARLLRGMETMDRKDYARAESDFRRVLEISPENLEALINLGRTLHNMLRSREALEMFDRALAMDPKEASIQLHRGIVLVVLGEYPEAVESLTRHLEIRRDPEALYFRGYALKALGDCERGVPDLQEAARGMAGNPDVFYALGRCEEDLSRTSEAESAYRKAVSLAPSTPRFALALGQLLMRTGRAEEGRAMVSQARAGYAQMVQEAPAQFQFPSTAGGQSLLQPE